jgi:hypothetical protein
MSIVIEQHELLIANKPYEQRVGETYHRKVKDVRGGTVRNCSIVDAHSALLDTQSLIEPAESLPSRVATATYPFFGFGLERATYGACTVRSKGFPCTVSRKISG